MKESIAIFYIGLPRFRKITDQNHKNFFKKLEEDYYCNYYDFTTSGYRKNCPYDSENITDRGHLQVWDFATALTKIKEDIILKFRTDVLLTPSSMNTILSELKKVVNNEISCSFLGHSIKNDFAEKYKIVSPGNGVGDLIILANKNNINSSDLIFEKLLAKDSIRSGNKTYPIILSSVSQKSNNVACQLYLVRKEYNVTELNFEWKICLDYLLSRTPKKAKRALEWFYSLSNFEDL